MLHLLRKGDPTIEIEPLDMIAPFLRNYAMIGTKCVGLGLFSNPSIYRVIKYQGTFLRGVALPLEDATEKRGSRHSARSFSGEGEEDGIRLLEGRISISF